VFLYVNVCFEVQGLIYQNSWKESIVFSRRIIVASPCRPQERHRALGVIGVRGLSAAGPVEAESGSSEDTAKLADLRSGTSTVASSLF